MYVRVYMYKMSAQALTFTNFEISSKIFLMNRVLLKDSW